MGVLCLVNGPARVSADVEVILGEGANSGGDHGGGITGQAGGPTGRLDSHWLSLRRECRTGRWTRSSFMGHRLFGTFPSMKASSSGRVGRP